MIQYELKFSSEYKSIEQRRKIMLTKVNQQSWHAHTPLPATRTVSAIDLTSDITSLPKYGMPARGVMAGTPGRDRVSVDAPMAIAQRPFHPDNVRKHIIKTEGQIDWNLFGLATAVRNKSTGETCIINGQHRISLVKTLDPTVLEVPAHIIDEDDEQYVARLFGLMNGGASNAVTREERLWADIVARDPHALAIESMLVRCNLGCGIVNSQNSDGKPNIQVNVATFEKCLAVGDEATVKAVSLIRCAYPTVTKNIDQQLLGLVTFLGLDEYKKIMDSNTQVGQRFVYWFTTVLPESTSFDKGLKFFANRNWSPSWEVGIAFGIATKFKYWLNVKGYPSITMITLKNIKQKNMRKFEEDHED